MNSTDETQGQPLAERVEARVTELEEALSDLAPGDTKARTDIEMSLVVAGSLMTGDNSHPSEVVASQLNDWLERNKHLAITATPSRGPEPTPDSKAE
jgi:hypothetical protein